MKKQIVKSTTYAKILTAAEKKFREKGLDGLGIDGLAKEAGVTSGAFYGNFKSKKEIFHKVIDKGINDYSDGIKGFQDSHGDKWVDKFLDYYLGQAHCKDIQASCIVPSLTAEVSRSGNDLKREYEKGLKKVIDAMNKGLAKGRHESLAAISLLAGAVLISRSVCSEKLKNQLLSEARSAVKAIIG